MTKLQSVDIRERVMAAVDGGLSRQGGGAVWGEEHLERYPVDGLDASDRRQLTPTVGGNKRSCEMGAYAQVILRTVD